jgi:hypothetical protein
VTLSQGKRSGMIEKPACIFAVMHLVILLGGCCWIGCFAGRCNATNARKVTDNGDDDHVRLLSSSTCLPDRSWKPQRPTIHATDKRRI